MRKQSLGILLILILVSMLTLTFNIQPVKSEPKTWTVDDDGPADFHTIQEAVDAANSGDVILVASGTYYGIYRILEEGPGWIRSVGPNVIYINKTLLLLGEDPDTTILLGGMTIHSADDTYISGFTINASCWWGKGDFRTDSFTLDIRSSNNVIIRNNLIGGNGIWAMEHYAGNVHFWSANSCMIMQNVWLSYDDWFDGYNGVLFGSALNNIIVGNNVYGPRFGWAPRFGIQSYSSSNNMVFHNNFWDTGSTTCYLDSADEIIEWDNGYPSGGNYWSDYEDRYPDVKDLYSGPYQNGTGSDEIWDHPYVIDEYNQDNYPLLNPWTPQNAIEKLIENVENMNLQQGIDNSLDAKLTAVLHALEALNADQRNDAINKLHAFINEVEAQREKKLTNEQADYLIAAAQEITHLIKG